MSQAVVTGPQLPDQGELKGYVRQLVSSTTVAACMSEFGSHLQAVILTGSMARDEATIVCAEGETILMGDADFLLVFTRRKTEPSDECLKQLAAGISAELCRRGVRVQIGLGSVCFESFHRLPAHSYTYELRAHGDTVWGSARAIAMIPAYAKEQLSREDAWRTLSHRMIELLGAMLEIKSISQPLPQRVHYATLKLCLDMATSYLIFAAAYEPTYAERSRRLCELASISSDTLDAPFPLADFADLVRRCTSWKLQSCTGDDTQPGSFLDQVIGYASKLWRWEVARLADVEGNSNLGILIQAITTRQGLGTRLQAWASLLRRMKPITIGDFMRWSKLLNRATPRYLIYRVAAELFFHMPCLLRDEGQPRGLNVPCSELRQLLPAVPRPESGLRWRDLAADLMWNYERFLIGTHA